MNHKHEALWSLKRCTLYVLCTLILFNFLHLTIGSNLTLIQNELWIPKCCHAHFKVLFIIFKVSKKCHQDFSLLHTYYTCYTSFFEVKSGSPIVCFHLKWQIPKVNKIIARIFLGLASYYKHFVKKIVQM
jgi:hypothetical protein